MFIATDLVAKIVLPKVVRALWPSVTHACKSDSKRSTGNQLLGSLLETRAQVNLGHSIYTKNSNFTNVSSPMSELGPLIGMILLFIEFRWFRAPET